MMYRKTAWFALGFLVYVGGGADVEILTQATFNDIVSSPSKTVFVKFYAPWCGHCKTLAPEWEKLGAAFRDEEDVVIAKVDATQEKELATQREIRGYPTLLMFDSAHPKGLPYEGPRALKKLVEHVNNVAGTFRREDGSLDEEFGRNVDVEKKLLAVDCAGMSGKACALQLKAAAQKAAAELSDGLSDFAKRCLEYYGKALEKTSAIDASYINQELARIKGLLGGALAKEGKRYATARSHILSWMEGSLGKVLKAAAGSSEEL